MSQAGIEPETQSHAPTPAARARRRWLAAAVLATAAALGIWYYWNHRLAGLGTRESVNVLVMGQSDEGVDALALAAFNPQTSAVAAVAVPPDTLVAGPAGPRQLRDVYEAGGEDALIAAVEELLSAPVHHTASVDFAGFVRLVDAVDGVPVEVETDIVYRDGEGRVVFHLEPGMRRLSGEEALRYLRYKADHLEDESRRVQRQWRFLTALAQEIGSTWDWRRVQEVLAVARTYVQTDMDLATITRLARFAWDARPGQDAVHVLPGRAQGGAWVPDPDQVRSLAARVFYNPGFVAGGR
ncbi:MAG: LCP family protein [Firmicutes bacterium]|nr:LCP family protein [Bacillota bacterium]